MQTCMYFVGVDGKCGKTWRVCILHGSLGPSLTDACSTHTLEITYTEIETKYFNMLKKIHYIYRNEFTFNFIRF